MKYPKSESLGSVKGPDGETYSLHFHGEDEGVATITGPSAPGGGVKWVKEVYRDLAATPEEARRKLAEWRRAQGWPA